MQTKTQVLNHYTNAYNDYDLIHLENQKTAIETEEDLMNYLETAIDHNYYTGSYWNDLYNFNKELENIVQEVITDENYFNYIVEYADRKGDIFILTDSNELIEIEKENKNNPILKYVFENYDRILTPEELDNIYYYDETEAIYYINEIYQIPERLESFIDYKHIIREFRHDPFTYLLNETEFINDYNKI